MKKICFLIGNINHSGGTERVTTLIANQLAVDHQVFILSLVFGENPFFEQNTSIVNGSLFNKDISMRKNFLVAVSKIREYIISNKIDTLVVVDSISCVFTVPACIGLKVNHICWEHFNLKVNLGSRFRDLGRWMAAKWCNQIITLTERDKTFWDERFNLKRSDKVVAIANPTPYEIQDNLPLLDYKNILCVGRLTYQKGFDLLIPAWAKIHDELPGWIVTIVGSGEDEQKLRKMATDYNVGSTIVFAGQQKDMKNFYRKASFFCMSSRFEGLPMVLLEAQSYGLPVVSFDCNTGPAEIIDSGINGFLVQNGNIEDLSDKILKMCKESNFEIFSKLSLEKSLSFNISNIIFKWEKVI
ncbi:glycosyltransferase family 4 protein [Acinetobacter rongchengensis]|uniref:Glycosyltransferase family 4 protein n=1 Tax=Acinetobacter rongchengensis TaxID=2419601 RepID=A0A3A8F6N5_9GAMM|nr:glycosyltransferase family 4 protein [Acinetobacter rongchengensis]RKG36791.1 glycosyltransferase family 4 protein [Acinetobacter rongchengensis]